MRYSIRRQFNMKRIKLKTKKPNPLFELWLEEWKKEAASKNSDLQYTLSKALESLRKYPLPLNSGRDCLILQHFGAKLCSMLDKKLEKHGAQNDHLTCAYCDKDNERTLKRKYKSQQVGEDANRESQRTELAEFGDLNLSSWDVGNFVILLILYKKTQDASYSGFTTELELLLETKEFCNRISKASVMKLFDNGLISMVNAPLRYSLTESGINTAKKICEVTETDIKLISSSDDFKKIQSQVKSQCKQKSVTTKSSANIGQKTGKKKLNECSVSIERSRSVEIAVNEIFKQNEDCFVRRKDKGVNINTERLQAQAKPTKDADKCTQSKAGPSKTNATNSLQKDIYLEPNNFDIILLVDTQETCGGKTKPQHDATLTELSDLGLLFEVRRLKVGDFAWIARCRVTHEELVLPYILERKRIDDLSASITDGRYYEQKFRLKQSGIPNLMYLIEEYDKRKKLTIPHASLMQASINTLIQDGFLVKYTKSHKDSMFYLSSITTILKNIFRNKILMGCGKETLEQTDISSDVVNLMEFKEFNKAASKQKAFKVSEMFIRHLLQIKGLSVDKAFAITEHYPTPQLLLDALQSFDGNAESLLSGIACGNKKRQLGTALSKTIHQLYTNKVLN